MDPVTLTKSEYRARQWASIIQACQSSGQTVVSWCSENSINIKSYYYWLRKLRLQLMNSASLPAVSNSTEIAHFKKIEIQTPAPTMQAAVMIHLPSATLEIQNGVSQQTIEAALLALKNIC